MRAIATIALIGLVLFVAGIITHDDAMSDVGISTFILGSMVVSALLMRRRHQQRRAETTLGAVSGRVPLTVALTESAVRSMRRKKHGEP
jgi:hydrogenase-4 membrane subunit HyfE